MAAWRRHALELFPTLREDINSGDYTIYMLYFDLLPMVRDAHDANDRDVLRKIYSFAEWCLAQQSEDLWNAAGVAFYEHLFDETGYRPQVAPWLSPKVVEECWSLWKVRLSTQELLEVERLIAQRREHAYRECIRLSST
jgi:hypothetical protein